MITPTSPLQSTFWLPEQAYGTFEDLPPINWTMADDTTYTIAITRNGIIADGVSVCTELQNAKEWVTRAVRVVDATNAQLALGGMYVNQSRNQLLA